MGNIDDSYLQGGTIADCDTNVAVTANLFCNLGFLLNQEKSGFEPRQIILGCPLSVLQVYQTI